MNIRFAAIALLFIIGLTACTTTYVTNSWTKPNARPAGLRRIAVLAMVKDESRGLRQEMEAAIVEELGHLGYTAYSTYAKFGPTRFDRSDEQKAIAQLKKSNTDAILTVVLLDRSQERNYNPGHVNYMPVATYYSRFWGYYTTVYDRTYVPGYYTTNTRYFWETNLYDLNQPGDDLIYSAQSQSFDPSSSSSLSRQYARAIAKDMIKAGIISK